MNTRRRLSAQTQTVTTLTTNLPTSRVHKNEETKFFIDTNMKEYVQFSVSERFTNYIRVCDGGVGSPYPNPRYPRGPYPRNYCRTVPQTQFRKVLSDKVRIEDMTLIGKEIIFNDINGEVNCGKMGRSRVFNIPTIYLSGKCNLMGSIYTNPLKINLNTRN